MSEFESMQPGAETLPEKEQEPKERKESSDAVARRLLCTTPQLTKAFNKLIEMHTYMRPAFCKTERKFIHNFIQPTGAVPDKFGNYFIAVGKAPVMWSSHTDTVHHKKGMQVVGFDKMEIGLAAEDKSGANCLGADDTAGVWLMLQMIEANVPGLYVFHRAEEGGRKGSQFIAKQHGELLKNVKFCIALDRKACKSVITFQSGDRTCSEAFAKSLIAQLGDMSYETDDTGSFTDSYSYTNVISECTNISVGYSGAHSTSERLDLGHIFRLREKLIGLDWKKLVAERVPGTKERKTYTYYSGGTNYNGRYRGFDEFGFDGGDGMMLGADDNWVQLSSGCYVRRESEAGKEALAAKAQSAILLNGLPDNTSHKGKTNGKESVGKLPTVKDLITVKAMEKAAVEGKDADDDDDDDDADPNQLSLLTKLCARNPQAIAELLDQMDFKYEDLRDEIMEMYGVVNC